MFPRCPLSPDECGASSLWGAPLLPCWLGCLSDRCTPGQPHFSGAYSSLSWVPQRTQHSLPHGLQRGGSLDGLSEGRSHGFCVPSLSLQGWVQSWAHREGEGWAVTVQWAGGLTQFGGLSTPNSGPLVEVPTREMALG